MNPVRWWKKERAIRISERLLRRGRTLDALDRIDSALKVVSDDPDLVVQKAWLLAELKQFDEALAIVDGALTAHADHGVLLMIRGELLLSLGRHSEARESLEKALSASGENLRIEYLLGRAHVALGDYDQAARYFESSVRYDKNLVQSRLLTVAERLLHERGEAGRPPR